MSFSLDWEEEQPIAEKNFFVDRNEFREILMRAVEDPQPLTEWRAVSFYGAGGQGKSALKNDFFIREYLDKSQKHVLYADRVDFEDQPKTRLADEALLRIAQDLIGKGGVPLPAFCLGFVRYKLLTSAEKNIQQDYPFLFKIKFIASEVANEVFNTIISTTVDLLVTGSQVIPGVSYFSKKASEKGHQKIVEWIQKSDAKSVLGDIDDLNALQLLHRLPLLLAYDINKYLRRGVTREHPYPSKRIIIIFDGYETLWHESANTDIDKDAWVRMLIEKTPGVLFVIFGREELRWHERDDTYNKILKQYRLSGIEDADADELLRLHNVNEEHVRKQIIRSSKSSRTPEEGCLPFYLDLQIKTYHRMVKTHRVPNPTDFQKNDDDVIHHFFEHIPLEVAGAIKALSLASYIDEEIIELFVDNAIIVPNAVSLNRLARYSFIRMDGERGIVHGLVKDLALRQYRSEYEQRFVKIQRLLFTHFNKKLVDTMGSFNSDVERYIEITCAHQELFRPERYVGFVLSHSSYIRNAPKLLIGLLQHAREVFIKSHLQSTGLAKFSTRDIPLSERTTYASIDFHLCQAYSYLEDYHRAADHGVACEDTLNRGIPPKETRSHPNEDTQHLRDIKNLRMYVYGALAKATQQLDLYSTAADYYSRASKDAQSLNVDFPFEVEYARYRSEVGLFAQAEPVLFSAYKKRKEELSKRSIISGDTNQAAHHLAVTLSRQQRYDEAISFHRENLEVLKTAGMTTHELYVEGLQALANTLVDEGGDLDEAGRLYDEIFEINRRKYDEDHLRFGYFFIDLSQWHMARLDMENAELYFNKGATILKEKIGPMSRAMVEAQINKALLTSRLYENGQTNENNYRLNVSGIIAAVWGQLPEAISILGAYNPLLHRSLEITVNELERRGDQKNASDARGLLDEFKRVTQRQGMISLGHMPQEIIPNGVEKSRLLNLFRPSLSLPTTDDKVSLTKVDLIFLREYKLYKIVYQNTNLSVIRYVFSNNETAVVLDYTNKSLYRVFQVDGVLDDRGIFSYCLFFFESVVGKFGGFTTMFDASELPWRRDIRITVAEREMLTAAVKQMRFVFDTEDFYLLEVFQTFRNALFRTCVIIYKQDCVNEDQPCHKGLVALTNEGQVGFRPTGEPLFTTPGLGGKNSGKGWYNERNELVDLPKEELLIGYISACAEPSYTRHEFTTRYHPHLTGIVNHAHACAKLMLDMLDKFDERQHTMSALLCRDEIAQLDSLFNSMLHADLERFNEWLTPFLELMDICVSIAEERRNTIQWQLAALREDRVKLRNLADGYIQYMNKELDEYMTEHTANKKT
jgi:tetratricopeptide (TPR) repeat protein